MYVVPMGTNDSPWGCVRACMLGYVSAVHQVSQARGVNSHPGLLCMASGRSLSSRLANHVLLHAGCAMQCGCEENRARVGVKSILPVRVHG